MTGNKGESNYSASSLVVSINGYKAITPLNVQFYYGLNWSKELSWGLEVAPREGDSVFLQKGRTLIVDQSTPILRTVIIEGTIIFADDAALEFNTHYLIIRKGTIIIGTEDKPY